MKIKVLQLLDNLQARFHLSFHLLKEEATEQLKIFLEEQKPAPQVKQIKQTSFIISR